VGNEEADETVAEVVRIDDNGVVLVRVASGIGRRQPVAVRDRAKPLDATLRAPNDQAERRYDFRHAQFRAVSVDDRSLPPVSVAVRWSRRTLPGLDAGG